MSWELNSHYIGVDKRTIKAGIYGMKKHYIERSRGNFLFLTPVVPAATYLLDESGLGSATAAYSLRKLRSAYAGSSIRVRRSSDNSEQDIGFSGENLDTSSLLTFCGAGNGFIVTWYDQSGNALDATQSTASNQPQIVSSGALITLNSKVCLQFIRANSHRLITSSDIGISGDASITSTIVLSYADTTTDMTAFGWGNPLTSLATFGFFANYINNGKNSIEYANTNPFRNSTAISSSTQYSQTATKTPGAINTTTNIYTNGSVGSDNGGSSASTPNITDTVLAIGRWTSYTLDFYFDGKIQELIIWNSTTPNTTTIYNNQDVYYAIP